MQIQRDKNGAMRSILASVEAAPRERKLQVFEQYCGPVSFTAGTYRAKCCSITATCTVDGVSAVVAWARKARDFLKTEE